MPEASDPCRKMCFRRRRGLSTVQAALNAQRYTRLFTLTQTSLRAVAPISPSQWQSSVITWCFLPCAGTLCSSDHVSMLSRPASLDLKSVTLVLSCLLSDSSEPIMYSALRCKYFVIFSSQSCSGISAGSQGWVCIALTSWIPEFYFIKQGEWKKYPSKVPCSFCNSCHCPLQGVFLGLRPCCPWELTRGCREKPEHGLNCLSLCSQVPAASCESLEICPLSQERKCLYLVSPSSHLCLFWFSG